MINSIKARIKGQLLKSILVVVSGTVFVQIINLVFSPILTRIFGPEAYGVLGVFITLISILTPLVALMYPIAIVISKTEEEVIDLSTISIIISIFIALILGSLTYFFGDTILTVMNVKELIPYKFIIPIIIILLSFTQIVEQWLLKVEKFKLRSRLMVVRSLFVNISQTGLGILFPQALLLIIITTIGYLISPLLTIKQSTIIKSLRDIRSNLVNTQYYKRLLNTMKNHIDFPKFRFTQEFINAFSKSTPIILFSVLFGPASVGFFVLGNRILSLPAQVIGNSVGDVLYPKYTEMYNKNESIHSLIRKSTMTLALIGIIPFGIVICWGPELFEFVFGENWDQAGEYARWLSLWSFFVFINNPSVRALPILGIQKMYLNVTILMTVLRVLGVLIGAYYFESELVAISLFSIFGIICNFFIVMSVLNKAKNNDQILKKVK